ncbi:MAG: MBL fold metallo-hydrolase [Chloroflexi bacterium]|nr:MBL fold metallo-hydrolase [Chloroflexota bacterium]
MYELAPQTYVETNFHHSNPGFIVTDEGVICFDSPLIPHEAQEWRRTIDEISGGLPILYVIVSDHHRGHCLGSQWLSDTVVAHELAWKHMRNYSDNFKQRVRDSFKKQPEIRAEFDKLKIIVPTLTFLDRMTVVRGERVVRIIHVGGHTPATSMVWLPVEKTLFAGDVVWVDQHPFMTQANSADWLIALERVRDLQPTYIIPGHGPICNVSALDRLSDYLTFLRQRTLDLYNAGRSKQETASLLIPELKPWFPIPTERSPKIESQIRSGIGRVYDEHRRAKELLEQQHNSMVEKSKNGKTDC